MHKFIAVFLFGEHDSPIAFFKDEEQAIDWARDLYFGQWLLREIEIDIPPMFTAEEEIAADKKADELIRMFVK